MLGWKKIKGRNGWELWETPSRYLVCLKYCNKYYFFDNLEKAKEFFLDNSKN